MSESWDNDFDPCDCKSHNCGCSGGRMTLAGPYLRVLDMIRPKTVYEWGPGFSTGLALGWGAAVMSIEHDKKYMPNIPYNEFFWCGHFPLRSDKYVTPQTLAEVYLVDGRRRPECITKTLQFITSKRFDFKPVLCLHDAQRLRYHKALAKWPHVRFLSRGFAVAALDRGMIESIPKGSKIFGR